MSETPIGDAVEAEIAEAAGADAAPAETIAMTDPYHVPGDDAQDVVVPDEVPAADEGDAEDPPADEPVEG